MDKFTIGQLAKHVDINIGALRHYDKVGVLKPEFVNPETNYRYYSKGQAEELIAILELRSLGMSLTDCKSFYKQRTYDYTLNMFKEHLHTLEETICELEGNAQTIREKINYLEDVETGKTLGMHYKFIEQRIVRLLPEPIPDNFDTLFEAITFKHNPNTVLPTIATVNYGAIVHSDGTSYLFNTKLKDQKLMCSIESGLFLCDLYFGDCREGLHNKAQELQYIAYLEGFVPNEEYIIVCLQDLCVTTLHEEIVYQIQIPVTKN